MCMCAGVCEFWADQKTHTHTHILNKKTHHNTRSPIFFSKEGPYFQLLSHKRRQRQRQRQRQPQAKTNRKHIGTTLPDV
jgi:hypothetical protein